MANPVLNTLTTNKPTGAVDGSTFDIDGTWTDADAEVLTYEVKVKNDASGAESAVQTISIPVLDPSTPVVTQTGGTPHPLTLVSNGAGAFKLRGTA